jgi:hypothetical protein
MDVATYYEAPDAIYRVEEGGGDGAVEENRPTARGVLQCFHFKEKRGRGSVHFGRGKEHTGRLLVPTWRGDWRMQQRAAATNIWSRAAYGLTRGGRQEVGPVEPKACLGWILLWRSNMLPKWNGLGKRDSWAERKSWRRI